MSANVLPEQAGIGFKPAHLAALLDAGSDLGFIEVHAENYMGAGGPVHARLDAARAQFPLSVHGVGLSIGGAEALDAQHLGRLARVVERFEPASVSEHLAWSSHGGVFFNDLLPIAYDEPTLARVVDHVQRVQERLRRRILIENPSTYFALAGSVLEEVDFLSELAARSGCALLLDLNNLVVSAGNRGESPWVAFHRFPIAHVAQVHLAGHASEPLADGRTLRIDDHGSPVGQDVWALYAALLKRGVRPPTLVEWDTDVPDFPTLAAEARRAQQMLHESSAEAACA
jgi:uncharacterized protein (UPF0276 family)